MTAATCDVACETDAAKKLCVTGCENHNIGTVYTRTLSSGVAMAIDGVYSPEVDCYCTKFKKTVSVFFYVTAGCSTYTTPHQAHTHDKE